MTTIASIETLPYSPYNGTGIVGIVITSGISTYFRITGTDLDNIVSFDWFPKNPSSILFDIRELILIDNTEGTIMVRVLDNYLDDRDRGGRLGFRLLDGSSMSFEVRTFGRMSLGPLWTAPTQGLITG